MSDWFASAVQLTGIPSEFFFLALAAFLLILFLSIASGISLFKLLRLKNEDTEARARQTLLEARVAWREDMGTAAEQTKEMIAYRIQPQFIETEKNVQKSMEDFSRNIRSETFSNIKALQDMLNAQLVRNDEQIRALTEEQSRRLEALTSTMGTSLENLRSKVDQDLKELNAANEAKLEKIRATVEEKLQSTLSSKIGESFEQVTHQLNLVSKGLGEMKELASDVGGLKRVLVNVKSRGMFGEVQLEAILSENLTESQYIKNAHPVPEKPKMVVEFAVKLPGVAGKPCLLPIDAKFPVEDYQRVQDAAERGDRDSVNEARKQLRLRLKAEARSISEYIHAPETTDFAIMFIPSEGLYAEVLSLTGLAEEMYSMFRVYIMGPSTLVSALCAYRAGFQTLAIERKSSEIRQILGNVQTEFGKFAVILAKLKQQVESVSNTVDQVQTRTRQMNLQLNKAATGEADEEKSSAVPLASSAAILQGAQTQESKTIEIRRSVV